jgi:hypothetical protein
VIRIVAIVTLCLSLADTSSGQNVAALIAPFDSSRTGSTQLGEKTGVILNLQIWQTLRIPPGSNSKLSSGLVIWDTFTAPPMSPDMARKLASHIAQDPRIVLWGRAWRYGGGTVVEAFLLVRGPEDDSSFSQDIWTVSLGAGRRLSVGVPRAEVEFAPIVLRDDLLADLEEPSGLRLYSHPDGDNVIGTAGSQFKALEQVGDSALIRLSDGKTGWVRLPNLSTTHSEVVDYTAGLIRIFRHDWSGALQMFTKVVAAPETPSSVRLDAYLYMTLASEKAGRQSYPWAKKAYEINPYSKVAVEYLCLSRISDYNHLLPSEQRAESGLSLLASLEEIVEGGRALFPKDDAWLKSVMAFLALRAGQ